MKELTLREGREYNTEKVQALERVTLWPPVLKMEDRVWSLKLMMEINKNMRQKLSDYTEVVKARQQLDEYWYRRESQAPRGREYQKAKQLEVQGTIQ